MDFDLSVFGTPFTKTVLLKSLDVADGRLVYKGLYIPFDVYFTNDATSSP